MSLADLLAEDGTWDDDDDAPEEPWEAQVARIAASTRTDAEAAQTPSLAQSMLASASQALLPPANSPYSAEGGFTSVTAEQLCCELVADAPPLVVDTSSLEAYAAGHIPGAVHVPLESLSDTARKGALGGRDAALVVVGPHSQQANVRLRRVLGFTKVRCLTGDTAAWTALGLPMDAGSGAGQ